MVLTRVKYCWNNRHPEENSLREEGPHNPSLMTPIELRMAIAWKLQNQDQLYGREMPHFNPEWKRTFQDCRFSGVSG
jgi:hypothetical protein